MNVGINKPHQAPGLAKKFFTANRAAQEIPHGNTSSEVRRRLLKMIKDNEQKRHSDISTNLAQH